jgi:DNA-binding GntR family transcriptional regulator
MDTSIDRIEQYLRDRPNTRQSDSKLLRDIAYERLKEAIQSVDVKAGDPLSESRLSSSLGISRTPVREALRQLVKDGLLQVIQGRGVVIAARSVQQVSDALHVRELLEPEVMRLAADSLPLSARELLQQYTDAMEQAALDGDRPTWAKVDHLWHTILCNHCPNHLLGQMVLQARNHMHNQGASTQVTDQYLIDGTREHRQVVNAIMEHDGKRAAELMSEHLGHLRENIFKRQV